MGDRPKLELRYHSAIPRYCKVIGLDIRPVPECEGGGFMIERSQAQKIVAMDQMLEALEAMKENYEKFVPGRRHHNCWHTALAAIAKAKGEETA